MLLLFIITVSFQANMADYDLFARLLQGKAFWSLGNILHQDIFSYTPTHIWYDHEWGARLIFYLFFKYMGVFGLVLVQGITMFFTAFFILISVVSPTYKETFFLLREGFFAASVSAGIADKDMSIVMIRIYEIVLIYELNEYFFINTLPFCRAVFVYS